MASAVWRQLLSRVPATCLLCRGICLLSDRLCRGCLEELPRNNTACFSCAEPLYDESGFLCGACQQKERPFWRAVVPLLYDFPVSEMLQALKYKQMLVYAFPLAGVLSDAVKRAYSEDSLPEVITPVPLHKARLLKRGYNQAGVLARHTANYLNLPVDARLVKRVKKTPPLLALSAKARLRTLKNAFRIKNHSYKHVALIDDIVTSTASIEAVAAALKKKGVQRVDVWCIARTSIH